MKKIYIILTLLIAILNIHKSYSYVTNKNIVIINSYDTNIEWSQNLSGNIAEYINKQFSNCKIEQFNLGINKNNGKKTDLIYLKAALSKNNDKIELSESNKKDIFVSTPPDLLIFIGNEGWLLYRSLYSYMPNIWKNTPILLTSVDNKIFKNTNIYSVNLDDQPLMNMENTKHIGDFKFNLTAVATETPIINNITFFLDLMPSVNNIIFLQDNYYSSLLNTYKIKKHLQNSNREIQTTTLYNFSDEEKISQNFENSNSKTLYITTELGNRELFYITLLKKNRLFYTEKNKTKPIYSINQNSKFNDYILGGEYLKEDKLEKLTEISLQKIFNNILPSSIPFSISDSTYTIINKTAAKEYLKYNKIPDNIIFYREPISFYYSNYEIINLLLFITSLLFFVLIYIYIQKKNIKAKEREVKKYKDLVDHIKFVFSNIDIRFDIFNLDGNKVNTFENTNVPNIICTNDKTNLFNNPFITSEIKERIKNKETITRYLNLYKGNNKSYKIIIQPVKTVKNKEIILAFTIDYSQISQKKIDNKTLKTMIEFATRKSKIGIAYFYPDTKKGDATDTWYKNLGISKNDITQFNFDYNLYSNIINKDIKNKIIKYIQDSKGNTLKPQLKEEAEVNAFGEKHWIKENIEIHNYSTSKNKTLVLDLNINIDVLKLREKELLIAKQKTESAKNDTNDFLANVSHEIRTPLNAILGFSNIILTSSSPEDIEPYKPIIEHNNETLRITINNILDLSKIDSEKMTITPSKFDLNIKFIEFESYAKSQFNGKQLELEVEIPKGNFILHTDVIFFDRLMTNLISNAIKFTNSGKIKIGYEVKNSYYTFFVSDTGIGISEENTFLIFNRFYKVDRFIEGTGLGLAFCQSIVSILGGKIHLDSKLGAGSKFSFDLPMIFHSPQ